MPEENDSMNGHGHEMEHEHEMLALLRKIADVLEELHDDLHKIHPELSNRIEVEP